MSIRQTNKILFLVLKRYTDKVKIHNKIEVPFVINSEHMKSDEEGDYELYGMIIHSGMMEGGHYIAVCRDEENKWTQFNDSNTYKVSEDNAQDMARDAYILAYRKSDPISENQS